MATMLIRLIFGLVYASSVLAATTEGGLPASNATLTAGIPGRPIPIFTILPFPPSNGSLPFNSTGTGAVPFPHVTVAPSSGGATCDIEDIQCPLCNDGKINSPTNNYTVFCQAIIPAPSYHTYPNIMTASECLQACDGCACCAGGFVNTSGYCSLVDRALVGPDSGALERTPGNSSYIAFQKYWDSAGTKSPDAPDADCPFSGCVQNPFTTLVTMHAPSVRTTLGNAYTAPNSYVDTLFSYAPVSSKVAPSQVFYSDCESEAGDGMTATIIGTPQPHL